MSDTPTLFLVNSTMNPAAAWAGGISSDNYVETTHDADNPSEGYLEADIIRGSFWPDIIGSGSGKFPWMVSRRVMEELRKLPAAGFDALPVSIGEVSSRQLRNQIIPEYFCLHVQHTIEVDLHYASEAKRQREAHLNTALTEASRIALRTETYRGHSIVSLVLKQAYRSSF